MFRLDYSGGCDKCCDEAELRKCDNLKQRLAVFASPRLEAYAREIGELDFEDDVPGELCFGDGELDGDIEEEEADAVPKKLDYASCSEDDRKPAAVTVAATKEEKASPMSDGSTDADHGGSNDDEVSKGTR